MSGFPSPNVGAGVEFAIALSGAGITGSAGEYFLTLQYQATVTVTANVVDEFGTTLGIQPTLAATSFNGPATQSGEASENTAMPQPNGGGSTYANSPNGPYAPAPHSQSIYAPGVYPNSSVASISASAPFVVTATGVGQALVEWRSPRGTTARLNVTGVQVPQ